MSSLDEAWNLVDRREAMASIAFNSTCFSISGVRDEIKDVYDSIREIELKLGSEGYSVLYETERDARSKMASGEAFSMLIVPTVSKKEVVDVALSGEVLSYKATRHIIPLRPLFLNVSFEWLYSKLSPEKINEKFVKQLSAKSFRRLPPGQIIDRRYEEELYLFK